MILSWPSLRRRRSDESADLPLLGDGEKEATPAIKRRKTRVPLLVGSEWEKQKRFTIPLDHTFHPLFLGLLKETEEDLGFDHQRPGYILLSCSIERFRQVFPLISTFTRYSGDYRVKITLVVVLWTFRTSTIKIDAEQPDLRFCFRIISPLKTLSLQENFRNSGPSTLALSKWQKFASNLRVVLDAFEAQPLSEADGNVNNLGQGEEAAFSIKYLTSS